ncbi:MAG: hypothetical protein HFE99_07455 [Ruminiclostridium sp.]|jgi:hypothetical protein|nr:hypothetical protein [Ruminiclostridium sp.]
MNELEIKRVPFMGTELVAARDADGQIWAGASYICKGIGLNKNEKDRQIKNIQADRVLSRGCVKFDAGVFDPNNETIAIKLDFVPLWLAKISITPTMEAETPELVDTLVEYQLKAKDVLAAAFLPKQYQKTERIYPHKSSSLGEIQKMMHELRGIMKDNDQPPEKISEMAQVMCDQFEINLPTDFVRRNPFQQMAIAGMFWMG